MQRLSDPETWVDEYGDYLYGFAIVRVRDRTTAEDLVQESLLSALKARKDFKGDSSEKTWLTSILKYKVIDLFRKSGREILVGENEEDISQFFDRDDHWDGHWNEKHAPRKWNASPAELLESNEFRTVVSECVMELPHQTAATFTLHQSDGLSCEEIGDMLGISANNCWVKLHRARLRLRRCLELKWFDT